MSAIRDFPSACYNDLGRALESLDYVRKRVGVFVRNIPGGAEAWLGLNRVRRTSNLLELFPIVGVVHKSLNSLVLSSSRPEALAAPTISMPLCYLKTPEQYETWIWREGANPERTTHSLVELLSGAGEAFIERYSTIEKLYDVLSSQDSAVPTATVNLQRVIPAAMYILGKFEGLPAFLQKERDENNRRGGDPDYDAFASKLLAKMASSSQ